MDIKLIKIPDENLDDYINDFILNSSEIKIAVSFFFNSGLNLFFKNLQNYKNKKKISIITSNYLNSTEPDALKTLLSLKKQGASIYIYDSEKSKKGFHLKCYAFKNESNNFYKTIIGSSNVSKSAFSVSIIEFFIVAKYCDALETSFCLSSSHLAIASFSQIEKVCESALGILF